MILEQNIKRLLPICASLILGLLLAGCTDYKVPGADKPWPKISDVPARPDPVETDRRRRKLYEQYGDLAQALPAPTEQPAGPPADALQVAVIQFSRASADLDDRAGEILTQVAAYAQQARADIMLFGYTSLKVEVADGSSARESARKLATNRLRAVGLSLAEKGVPIDRLQLVARGNLDPAWQETNATGEAGNRRVEIWFTR